MFSGEETNTQEQAGLGTRLESVTLPCHCTSPDRGSCGSWHAQAAPGQPVEVAGLSMPGSGRAMTSLGEPDKQLHSCGNDGSFPVLDFLPCQTHCSYCPNLVSKPYGKPAKGGADSPEYRGV